MHQAAYTYIREQVQDLDLTGVRVLEIGALNVNGSVRELFPAAAEYVGIDAREGRGVDLVVDAREYDGEHAYDIAITTEALEHDADPFVIIDCAARALRPGGVLLITAAGEGRTPHGCDGGPLPPYEPYQNITRTMLEALLDDWADVAIVEAPEPRDIYARACAPKKGKER